MANADGLGRIEELLKALGDPQRDLNAIHVAGTNGKGSTCVMIASILQEAGYSVGLFTSPHLETERERIQIWNSEGRHMIEQDVLDKLREQINKTDEADPCAKGSRKLTVFEMYTAAAYLYFSECRPDYVVLECGMGGRLDSTNTIEDPLACVITQVGLDHTDELGSTVEEVAYNKAGIIKRGVPVVSQTDDDAVRKVIMRVASENDSEFIDVNSSMSEYGYLLPAMEGGYQKKNAVTAALAVKASGADVTIEALKNGIAKAVLEGRFEILSDKNSHPVFIVDGAHNPDAMKSFVTEYNKYAMVNNIESTVVIFGCMQDKNSTQMVDILTSGIDNAYYLAVAIEYGRAEDPLKLEELISSKGKRCRACSSTEEAFEIAMNSDADCILAAGSIYLAGEMRSIYKNAF